MHIIVPEFRVIITPSGEPDEGQTYTLTCVITIIGGSEQLSVSMPIEWYRVSNSELLSRNASLTFNPLRRDDEGDYNCTSTITSPYLSGTRTIANSINVTVGSKYNCAHTVCALS